METIIELLVKKKSNSYVDLLKNLGLILGVLILSLFASMFNATIAFLLFASFAFLAFKIHDRFFVEFDYCLFDGNLRIGKVFSQKSRKEFISIDKDTVELVAPFGSSELENYKGYKTIYATNKDDEVKYVVVGVSRMPKRKGDVYTSVKTKAVITGDERLIEHYKRQIPRKVIV